MMPTDWGPLGQAYIAEGAKYVMDLLEDCPLRQHISFEPVNGKLQLASLHRALQSVTGTAPVSAQQGRPMF